jgi:hypothetical protein
MIMRDTADKATAVTERLRAQQPYGMMPGMVARPAPAREDAEIFQALKAVLAPYAPKLTVKEDSATTFYLVTKSASYKGKPLFFGAVIQKSYVSYHLMPLYWKPELLKGMSPELRKRMQGKSCFNFKKVEPTLFKELARLTRTGFEAYRAAKLL